MTWDFAWPIVEANSTLAEKIFLRVANRVDHSQKNFLPSLTEMQLASLYLKVGSIATEPTQRFSAGGFVTPRQNMVHFRSEIINSLESRVRMGLCRSSVVGKNVTERKSGVSVAVAQRSNEQTPQSLGTPGSRDCA